MKQAELTHILAIDAIERRSKESHRKRENPQEVIATDGGEIKMKPQHIVRFWRKIRKTENGCWEWQGSRWDNGYGRFMVGKKRRKTHRIAFLLENGFLPADGVICHKCDNPPCCNPDHLWAGSNLDNTNDMIIKERQTHGERNGRSILTDETVKFIRDNPVRGREANKRLADIYGCSINSIYNARKGTTWKLIN